MLILYFKQVNLHELEDLPELSFCGDIATIHSDFLLLLFVLNLVGGLFRDSRQDKATQACLIYSLASDTNPEVLVFVAELYPLCSELFWFHSTAHTNCMSTGIHFPLVHILMYT